VGVCHGRNLADACAVSHQPIQRQNRSAAT
jgi:hypothetical protein